MGARLVLWVGAVLVLLSLALHTLLAGPKYVLFGGALPDPRKSTSARIGERAIAGERWALAAEYVVDWIFLQFKGERRHCRQAWYAHLRRMV